MQDVVGPNREAGQALTKSQKRRLLRKYKKQNEKLSKAVNIQTIAAAPAINRDQRNEARKNSSGLTNQQLVAEN